MAYTPLTWKNVSREDNSALFAEMGKNNTRIASGYADSLAAVQTGVDNYEQSQTDAFLNDLTQFENRPLEADAFIKDRDTSWIDMARLKEARKELTSETDEIAMFAEKEGIKHANTMLQLELEAKAKKQAASAKKNKPISRGDFAKKLSKRDTIDGNNPFNAFLGFDSPIQDMDDLVQNYIKTKKITDTNKQEMVRSIIFNDSSFDTDMMSEYYFGNGKSADNVKTDYIDKLLKAKNKEYLLK